MCLEVTSVDTESTVHNTYWTVDKISTEVCMRKCLGLDSYEHLSFVEYMIMLDSTILKTFVKSFNAG